MPKITPEQLHYIMEADHEKVPAEDAEKFYNEQVLTTYLKGIWEARAKAVNDITGEL